jgi:HPt (histidine-containing phosphotransfer) domain-containing protein
MASALERVDGDLELMRELVGLFRDDCPRRMDEIRRAIDGRDGPRLESASHYLKGSAGNLGSRPAFDAAGRLERDGREGNWDRVEEDWTALGAAIGHLESAFDDILGTVATAPSDVASDVNPPVPTADGESTFSADLDPLPRRIDA